MDPWTEPGLLGLVAAAVLAAAGLWLARRPPVRPEIETNEGAVTIPARPAPPSLAGRFRAGLARTRAVLGQSLDRILGGAVDEAALVQLEEALLTADVGVPTTARLIEALRVRVRGGERDGAALRLALRDEIRALLGGVARPLHLAAPEAGPCVVLVVGVNGSGKTTTIGKLAARLRDEGRQVMLAAGDTYRAAAGEQLAIWAERAGARIVRHSEGADPGAVVFDAMEAARARGCDVVLIDTAGRLQTAKPLMEQLGKVRRVVEKKQPGAPHETLLVLDGTMGQNALSQARHFHAATPVTGVVVTKLDGTAKGGMILAVSAELGLPVKLVGIGERVEDLRDFDVEAFTDALIGSQEGPS